MIPPPPESGSFLNLFTKDTAPPRPASAFWNLFTSPDAAPLSDGETVTHPQMTPCALHYNEDLMYWALRNLPVTEAPKHLAVVGVVGSGKTTLIRLFLQSLAPRFRRDAPRPEQLIVFDGKCDIVPLLSSMGLHPEDENVFVLNPYDERGVPWDLADGAKGPLMARHLASLLVPEEPRSTSPFFAESARDLVYAVILALNARSGASWTFRDLICALDSMERIKAVTAIHSRASVIASRILDDDKHAFGVLSSVATKLVKFEPVAALWHSSRSTRRFRIQEFLSRPGVLVLGNDPALRDSLWPINALLLKALTQEILRRDETRQPRHWFVLDEFPAMEKLDCIHELLRRGRSKGVSALLGMQGIEGPIEVYQANAAEEILSLCSYKTFLRAGGPKTAEYAERYFGKVRRTESVWSESWSRNGHSCSVQHNITERSLFLNSVFLNLPSPERGQLFYAISDVPCLGSTIISRRWFDQVLSWLNKPADIPAVLRRDSEVDQTLLSWTDEEEEAMCQPPPSKRGGQAKSKKPRKKMKPGKKQDGDCELPDPSRNQRRPKR